MFKLGSPGAAFMLLAMLEAPLPAGQEGLVAQWKFEEGRGERLLALRADLVVVSVGIGDGFL